MIALFQLDVRQLLKAYKSEGIVFSFACLYLIFEYVRPQGIYTWLDALPWAQLVVVLAVIGMFVDREISFVRTTAFAWLALFFVVILISSATAFSSDIAFENLDQYYTWTVIVVMLVHVVNNEKRFYLFIIVFFLACYKMSLFGARTWVMRGFSFADWGVAGPPGYFQNSGELSLLMAMFAVMSLAFYFGIRDYLSKIKRMIFLTLPLTAVMTVLMSSSRGSQLALVAGMSILVLVLKKVSFRTLLAFIACGVLAWSLLPEEQKERFSEAGEDATSLSRLVYWERGIDMAKDHPFFGVGYWNFPVYFSHYYPEDVVFHGREEVSHNIFIQVGSTLGFIGLGVFAMIMLSAWKQTRRARQELRKVQGEGYWLTTFSKGLDAALVTYVIGGQFMSVAFYPYLWIHLSLAVICRNIASGVEGCELSRTTLAQNDSINGNRRIGRR